MQAASIIDDLARELGVSREALKKWRQRKVVPHRWRQRLIDEAARRGLDLPYAALESFPGGTVRVEPRRQELSSVSDGAA